MGAQPGWADMTIEELIEELMKIEDKNKIVKFNVYDDIYEIGEYEDGKVYIFTR